MSGKHGVEPVHGRAVRGAVAAAGERGIRLVGNVAVRDLPARVHPASVRPATTRRTGSGTRRIVVSAAPKFALDGAPPGWAAQPEKPVPS